MANYDFHLNNAGLCHNYKTKPHKPLHIVAIYKFEGLSLFSSIP